MPELPEVQTVVNYLNNHILNLNIKDVIIKVPKVLKNCCVDQVKLSGIGQCFINIDRIGKWLVFYLSNNQVYLIHLRMEGKIFYQRIEDPWVNDHVMLIIVFNNQHELRFYDTRKFGCLHLYDVNTLLVSKEIKKIGFDPVKNKLTVKRVKDILSSCPNKMLKSILLDQTKICGIGNIYANEICFLSRLHPSIIASHLSEHDIVQLRDAIKKVLSEAIKYNGCSVSTYRISPNLLGSYQKKLKVHNRKNQDCYFCFNKIIKTKIANRGTYLCPVCQIKK